MEICANICRFCLKSAPASELIPLFAPSYDTDGGDWKRIANFIYPAKGVPDSICSTCYVQTNWILAYQRQIYENDCHLRAIASRSESKLAAEDQEDFLDGDELMVTNQKKDFSEMYNTGAAIETPDGNYAQIVNPEYDNSEMEVVASDIGQDISDLQDEQSMFHALVVPDTKDLQNDEIADLEETKTETTQNTTNNQPKYDNGSNRPTHQTKVHKQVKKIKHKITDKNEKFSCFCGKIFTQKGNLKRHKRTHDDFFADLLECSTCAKKFVTKEVRDEHVKTVHQGFYYKCPLCPQNSKFKRSINRHIKTKHPGETAKPLELQKK
jgi:hypothetical protein